MKDCAHMIFRIAMMAMILVVLSLAVTRGPKAETVLEGIVTHVRDGDTIEVAGIAIRLQGLHAPELGEPGGYSARVFMLDLVEKKEIRCVLTGERSYNRIIGVCYLDGLDIAAQLVQAGLGRDCPRYSGGKYRHLESHSAIEIHLPNYC